MRIFVDTSAFYALLDRDDASHLTARKVWTNIVQAEHTIVTSNYVLVETFALLRSRLGMEAVRGFQNDLLPVVNVDFVSPGVHRSGIAALLSGSRRAPSLVDCVSFEIMRSAGIQNVFTYDRHFKAQGFTLMP